MHTRKYEKTSCWDYPLDPEGDRGTRRTPDHRRGKKKLELAIEILAQGGSVGSVLQHLSTLEGFPVRTLPAPVIKYLFCCPNFDFQFRCLPSSGGFYDQRHRDFIEFAIIESRIRHIKARKQNV